MWTTYEFPLPPKGCPSREPGGYCTIPHYVTDASLAAQRREPRRDVNTVDTASQEVDASDMYGLNTGKRTDNTNTMSNECSVCNSLGAHRPLRCCCLDHPREHRPRQQGWAGRLCDDGLDAHPLYRTELGKRGPERSGCRRESVAGETVYVLHASGPLPTSSDRLARSEGG